MSHKGPPGAVAAIAVIVLIAVGIAAIVAGGFDDSPGGQLIGDALIVVGAALGVRIAWRRR